MYLTCINRQSLMQQPKAGLEMNTIQHLVPLATILFSVMNITLAADLPERDSDFYQKIEKLKDDARQKGRIPIIVKLQTPFTPEGKLKNDKINEQRNAIKKSSENISKTIKDIDKNGKTTEFEKLPYITTMANEYVIDALSKDPNVNLIYKDITAKPTLDISIPLIHSNIAYSQGFSGQGQTIAIIDSGVRLDHEFLNGKIVSQACFSGSSGGISLCPGGASSSFAAGSAADCPINISGCGHGTHVAGIAVGKNNQFSGVAKDANLIAIKTATQSGNEIIHSTADIASGLNRVYDLRNQFKIAAANLSLGDGSLNSGSCDNLSPLVTDAINQLKSVGIATVVSAGNNYYMSSPDTLNFGTLASSH